MKNFRCWTPAGCGASAMGFAETYPQKAPVFPEDLVIRVNYLDLGVESLFYAWEITRLLGGDSTEKEQRALILLVLATMFSSAGGSTRLPLTGGSHFERALNELDTTGEELAAIEELLMKAKKTSGGSSDPLLADVFGGPGDYRPLIIDHDCLYIQKLHVLEARVGGILRQRIVETPESETVSAGGRAAADMENALDEVFNSPPVIDTFGKIELDCEQKEAVRKALSGQITIISGRPGSGKTSIVASLLRVLARTGSPPLESIALAAPTGKAADRMRQSIAGHLAAIPDPGQADRRLAEACPPALTLHRLLSYLPGMDYFRHNENNLLSEQLVIVDESSMIDLAMMDNLLRALRSEAQVIFIGDADQLPSIEAGAVMQDLCRAKTANEQGRVVVLTTSYRARKDDASGKSILGAAALINEGISPAGLNGKSAPLMVNRVSELQFKAVEHLQPGDENQRYHFQAEWLKRLRGSLPDLDDRLLREYLTDHSGFDEQTANELRVILSHYEKFRILCVTRISAGGTGTEALNRWFHHRWHNELKKTGIPPLNQNFLPGEPVLVTRNNYKLRLYNGDSGLVLQVKISDGTRCRPAEPMAVFPTGSSFVAFPLEALRGHLDLAWATTVHKAQGSEYEYVALMLPEIDVRPLTRELLYTAVTRAKKAVTIVGSVDVLETGIKRTTERHSGLTDILR